MAIGLACLATRPSAATAPSVFRVDGSLVAAFVTKDEILLMSDGRAVSATGDLIVRDDLSKVHRLSGRAGLLTAGRVLPGLAEAARAELAERRAPALLVEVAAVAESLKMAWAAIEPADDGGRAGRSFVFVAGFDEPGNPRVFYLDTRRAPDVPVNEIGVLGDGRELDVVAIASNPRGSTDASDIIVRQVSALYATNRGLARQAILIAAFKAAQAEISSYNPRIGGETFAAVIDLEHGYRPVDIQP